MNATRPLGVVVVAVGVAHSSWLWRSIFAAESTVVLFLVGTVVVTSAIVVLAAGRGWSPVVSGAMTAALGLIVLVASYRLDVVLALPDLATSWKRLASTGLYVPASREQVLVPIVVTAATTWLAVEVFLRSSRGAAAIAPLLVAHLVALAYTGGADEPTPLYVGLLAALVFAVVVLSGSGSTGSVASAATNDGTVSMPLLAAAGAMGLVFLVAVTSITDLLGPRTTSFSMRDRLARPLAILSAETPLAEIKTGLITTDPDVVFSVEPGPGSTGLEIDRIPVAFLDRYNGSIWYSSARFEAAGERLPRPAQADTTPGPDIELAIELAPSYPFQTLPTPGEIRHIQHRDLGWDPITGLLIGPDLPPAQSVTMQVAAPPVSSDEPSFGPGAPGLGGTELPEMAGDQELIFTDFLARTVTESSSEMAQLEQLEEALLSDRFLYNPEAPAGHNVAALAGYVDEPPGEVAAGIGFAEQASSVFALLARQLGLPSRVVVGYLLDTPIGGGRTDPIVVREDQIHAWPEVWSSDQGWIRFEPSSRLNQTSAQSTRTESLTESSTAAAGSTSLTTFDDPVLMEDPLEPEPTSRRRYLFLLLVVPLYLGTVVTARTVRRLGRRFARSPARRTAGAWHHTRDSFAGWGIGPRSTARSVRDLLGAARSVRPSPEIERALAALAVNVDQALYAPAPPTGEQAVRAWREATAATKAARRSSPIRVRTMAAISPRWVFGPLGGPKLKSVSAERNAQTASASPAVSRS